MSRLISHLFQQRSFVSREDLLFSLVRVVLSYDRFYPLVPPNESVAMEYEQVIKHAKIESMPHLFITSSDLRPFIKVGLSGRFISALRGIKLISSSILSVQSMWVD